MDNESLLKRALKIQYSNAKNKVLKTIEGAGNILQLPQAAMTASLVETNPYMKAKYIGSTGRTDVGLRDLFSKNHDDLKPSTIVNSDNNIVNFAVDTLSDPITYTGIGVAGNSIKNAYRGSKGLSTINRAINVGKEVGRQVFETTTGISTHMPSRSITNNAVEYALRNGIYDIPKDIKVVPIGTDFLKSTKSRLKDGAYDRIMGLDGDPDHLKRLMDSEPRIMNRPQDVNPESIAHSTREYYTDIHSDLPNSIENEIYRTPLGRSNVVSHEFAHHAKQSMPANVFNLNKENPFLSLLKKQRMDNGELMFKSRNSNKYFTQGGNDEIYARGTEIKNLFGLKNNEPITEDHLKAVINLIDGGVYPDNHMRVLYGAINKSKMKEFLEKMTKYSIVGSGIGYGLNNKNNEKNKK